MGAAQRMGRQCPGGPPHNSPPARPHLGKEALLQEALLPPATPPKPCWKKPCCCKKPRCCCSRRCCAPQAATRVVMTQVVSPADSVGMGICSGGTALSWIDICAGLAAKTLARGPVVTASVDAVHFLRPARVGSVVIIGPLGWAGLGWAGLAGRWGAGGLLLLPTESRGLSFAARFSGA